MLSGAARRTDQGSSGAPRRLIDSLKTKVCVSDASQQALYRVIQASMARTDGHFNDMAAG